MTTIRFLLLLAALACATAYAKTPTKPIELDRVVAVVNSDAITLFELNGRIRMIEAQLKRQGTAAPPEDVLRKQILERIITDKVQLQLARETGLRVDDVELDQAITRIAENSRMSLAEFRKALTSDGTSWKAFREDIRDEMIIARLREREVENRIVISEGEIDNYLANPGAAGAAADEVRLSHILLRVPENADPVQLQQLRQRAEAALAQVKSGGDFAQVAAAFSQAPDALNGGDIGWRSPDRLPALFAETAAKLKIGEVSGVLKSPAGFHILKLTERRGGTAAAQKVQQTHARHILIKTSELVSEAEAVRKLEDLKDRLNHGADFAELARLYSNDLSAARGGDLGWIYPGDTVPQFERAMNTLKPNEVSSPVQSPFGWHLIQVL